MYRYINDPETNSNISIYSKKGKKTLRKYLNHQKGGTGERNLFNPMNLFTGKETLGEMKSTYRLGKKQNKPILLKEFEKNLTIYNDPEYQDLVIADACKTAIMLLGSLKQFKVNGKNLSCSTFRDEHIKDMESELDEKIKEQKAIKQFTKKLSNPDNDSSSDIDKTDDSGISNLFVE